MDKLLGTVLRPVNRRGAKLHLIFGGGGSDRMERGEKRVRRVRRREGEGGVTVVDLIRHVRTRLGKMSRGKGAW